MVNGTTEVKTETKEEPMEVGTSGHEVKTETETGPKPWGICLADMDNCTVHSTILPKTHWSYIGSAEVLDKFIDSLNPRGVRESELKDKLVSERDAIVKDLRSFNVQIEPNLNEDAKDKEEDSNEDINAIIDLALRDQIMEIEEKIFFGTLGTLKIHDRQAWQKAIQAGGYDKQCDALTWGGKSMMNTPFESRMMSADQSRDQSRAGSPDRESNRGSGEFFVKRQSNKVRGLACAMLQVSQMLANKYFKPPLGEDEKEIKKRLKEEEKRKKQAEKEGEENSEVAVITEEAKDIKLTPLQEWENSLMSSTSYAQLFVHMTTLDTSIIWSKSILNTRCRICRRKADPESMLLCDGCDRGHHLYCLKPKLKKIPSGDWFCHECKPKERVKSPKKKSRRVFEPEPEPEPEAESEEEEEAEDDEEEAAEANSSDDEAAENGDEDQEQEEEQEETPPRRTKKSKRSVELPTKKKAKKEQQAAPATASKKGLSNLLGKRKSAARASEKMASFVEEEGTASGNSSESESTGNDKKSAVKDLDFENMEDDEGANGERKSTRLRGKPATSAKQLKEQRMSVDGGLSKAQAKENARSKAQTKRRRALDEELLNMYNPSALEELLNNMMKHKDGWPFDRPITRSDAPDYFEIIKKPLDLGTIRTALLHMKYTCNQEVLSDIKIVFGNCYRYNAEDAEEYQCAGRLEKYFGKIARKLGLVEEEEDLENQPLSKKSRRTL